MKYEKIMLGLRTKLLLASAVILFACGVRAETWRTYHNSWFGTTADVPANWSMSPITLSPEIENGGLFSSPDIRAEILVKGSYFDELTGAKDMAIITELSKGETITYQKRGPRWIVRSGTRGDRIFYIKSIVTCRDTILNDLSIFYPAAEKEKYQALVAHVAASLRGDHGNDFVTNACR